MAFKQRSSGLPFKEMGSSPAKQSYPSSSQTGPHGPTGTLDEVKKIAARKAAKPYTKPPSKLPPYSTAKKELAKNISAKNIKVDLPTGKKEYTRVTKTGKPAGFTKQQKY